MLKLSVVELFIRLIPEVLVLIFASYSFSKVRVERKKYIVASILLGVCVFTIRMLPIHYGVHTILNLIALTIIVSNINKIDVIDAIKSSIMTTIILFICEGINVMVLKLIVGDRLDVIVSNSISKAVYFLPSLLLLAIIVLMYYNYMKKRNRLKDV